MMQDRIHILYVVVLYGQKYEMTSVYNTLLTKVNKRDIWIWDNSANHNINAHLHFGVSNYYFSEVNKGLSFPYNRASEYAYQNGYQWMVLLDQDTQFDASFINVLEKSIRENPNISLFCPQHCLSNGIYLSPARLFLKFTRLSKKQVVGIIDISRFGIINSGLSISVDAYRKVGGYNEKVFLDYSDFQFLDRLAKIESKAYCLNSICVQNFSNDCVDRDKLLKRFTLFCKSLNGINSDTLRDNIGYKLVVVKRCISLILRVGNFRPLIIFFKEYIRL